LTGEYNADMAENRPLGKLESEVCGAGCIVEFTMYGLPGEPNATIRKVRAQGLLGALGVDIPGGGQTLDVYYTLAARALIRACTHCKGKLLPVCNLDTSNAEAYIGSEALKELKEQTIGLDKIG
jgi:hypothetical protein